MNETGNAPVLWCWREPYFQGQKPFLAFEMGLNQPGRRFERCFYPGQGLAFDLRRTYDELLKPGLSGLPDTRHTIDKPGARVQERAVQERVPRQVLFPHFPETGSAVGLHIAPARIAGPGGNGIQQVIAARCYENSGWPTPPPWYGWQPSWG